jgi:hypothetical protein
VTLLAFPTWGGGIWVAIWRGEWLRIKRPSSVPRKRFPARASSVRASSRAVRVSTGPLPSLLSQAVSPLADLSRDRRRQDSDQRRRLDRKVPIGPPLHRGLREFGHRVRRACWKYASQGSASPEAPTTPDALEVKQ